MAYRLSAALWGGVFGAFFGGLGGLLGHWFRGWSGKFAAVGAILGFVSGQAIEQFTQPTARFVEQRTTRPIVDRLKIDDALLDSEEIGPLYRAIKARHPIVYARIRDRLATSLRSDKSMKSFLPWAQVEISKLVNHRLMNASNDLAWAALRHNSRLFEDFYNTDPTACISLFRGNVLGDKVFKISFKLRAAGISIQLRALSESHAKLLPGLTQRDYETTIGILLRDLEKSTAYDTSILTDAAAQEERPKELCAVVAQHYRITLSSLKPEYSARFFRQMTRDAAAASKGLHP